MCSITLGPAICPSLVTWPTSTSVEPLVLAWLISAEAQPLSCEMVPGAASTLSDQSVCTESMTTREGGAVLPSVATILATLVSVPSATGASRKPKSRSAHAHLGRRLLAGEIDDGEADLGKSGRRLQQERRFADAGIAADQHGRARHQAAAEHPVELGDAGGQPRAPRGSPSASVSKTASRALPPLMAISAGRAGRRLFLDDRVPLAAGGAFAGPAGAHRAAGLADEGA